MGYPTFFLSSYTRELGGRRGLFFQKKCSWAVDLAFDKRAAPGGRDAETVVSLTS